MKNYLNILLWYFLFSLITKNLVAQNLKSFLSDKELEILEKIQPLVHNAEFSKADDILQTTDSVIKSDLHLFLMQTNSFWRYIYSKNDSFLTHTLNYGQRNIDYLESALTEDNLRPKFFLGATYGYLGLAKIKEGSLLAGIKNGKKGYKIFREILNKYPSFNEVGLGLGIYEGMAAQLPMIFRWLAYFIGIKGDYQKSIEYLKKASQQGMITRADALFFYYGFLADHKDPQRYSILDSLIALYPKNPLYHFMKGINYSDKLEYEKSIKEFELSKIFLDESFVDLQKSACEHLGKLFYRTRDYQKCIDNLIVVEKHYLDGDNTEKLDEIRIYIYNSYLALGDDENSQRYFDGIKNKKLLMKQNKLK